MAKLIFRYGAMGSSKTANARCEDRDGAKIIKSRIGLEEPCEFAEDFLEQYSGEHYDCVIVDDNDNVSVLKKCFKDLGINYE